MTSDQRRELAERYGYEHYTCRKHGGFWSDSGPDCEYCPREEEENEDEDAEG